MADLSPAEIMLNSLVPAQRLIKRLQDVLKAPVSYVGIPISPEAKAVRAAFQNIVQRDINELTAQREKCVALVNLIPDQTARTVIELCYLLSGSGCEKMPYVKVGEMLHYSDKTILRYHKKAIDQLNRIIEPNYRKWELIRWKKKRVHPLNRIRGLFFSQAPFYQLFFGHTELRPIVGVGRK